MTSDPVELFPAQATWTPVDSAITATIGAGTARGGFGILGQGFFFKGVAWFAGSGDAPAAGVSNYGYVS